MIPFSSQTKTHPLILPSLPFHPPNLAFLQKFVSNAEIENCTTGIELEALFAKMMMTTMMMGSSLSINSHLPLIHSSNSDFPNTLFYFNHISISNSKPHILLKSKLRTQKFPCFSSNNDASNSTPSSNFCIIEGPEAVQDFVQMQLKEIEDNIRSRRNKIFLLMEEVRRLRVQQRLKGMEIPVETGEQENEMPDIPSSIPFLPHVTPKTLKQLYMTSFSMASGIIVFGGLLAPILELKLGLGGTSYADFIHSLNLPTQLSQVDPIVASFSGGAVGVISSLMLIEVNNVEQQEKKRCKYCLGSGYLACAQCSASGFRLNIEPVSINGYNTGCNRLITAPNPQRCSNCSGTGKVMCTTCLCTGMAMASEHDPRIDPFD